MRINKFIAQATGMSRREADRSIAEDRVTVNGKPAGTGTDINRDDIVKLDGQTLATPARTTTIILNKPVSYVVSRDGQGSPTIYDLLPSELHKLKPVGRLDRDSSGLLLLTDDGELANRLTHPRYGKQKIYTIKLDKTLPQQDQTKIQRGVELEDGLSKLQLKSLGTSGKQWQVTMSEGRNRQIRRTFSALGYHVTTLHRTQFGPYRLPDSLASGGWEHATSQAPEG